MPHASLKHRADVLVSPKVLQTPAAALVNKYRHLADAKIISQESLIEFSIQAIRGTRPETVMEKHLHEAGVSLAEIGEALEKHYEIPYFHFVPSNHLKPYNIIEKLKRKFIAEAGWAPIEEVSPHHIVVVTTDPNKAQHTTGGTTPKQVFDHKTKIEWKVTTETEYELYIEWLYSADQTTLIEEDDANISDLVDSLGADDEEEGDDAHISEAEDNDLVRIVNKVLIDAYKRGVSDIHFEPALKPKTGKAGKSEVRIRFRLDGAMVPYQSIPWKYRQALLSRIKVMANLDIAEKRKPQDGKIKMKSGNREFELRVATCPSVGDLEDAVLRILAASEPLPINKMGFSARNEAALISSVSRPYGLFYVCGPTGSGKTTTLHSVLGYLNKPDTKIWTAEDPVEITQSGLRQVQVNRKAGIDFAMIMRAFLRLDPDVIMVGESRDKETVTMGVEASLTGHLVFSTLHTNSAPESIIRLIDMGVDPFNFADALLGILAQRLARTLCKDCKELKPASTAEIKSLISEYCEELLNTSEFKEDKNKAANSVYSDWLNRFGHGEGKERKLMLGHKKEGGCEKCGGTGYKGRVGLHELMIASDRLKAAIQQHARPAEMLVIALEEGMRTLKQDGIEKVINGLCDMGEIRKVCIK